MYILACLVGVILGSVVGFFKHRKQWGWVAVCVAVELAFIAAAHFFAPLDMVLTPVFVLIISSGVALSVVEFVLWLRDQRKPDQMVDASQQSE
jgi:hypothetical protein